MATATRAFYKRLAAPGFTAPAKSNLAISISRAGAATSTKKLVLLKDGFGGVNNILTVANGASLTSPSYAASAGTWEVVVVDAATPEAGAIRFVPGSGNPALSLDLKPVSWANATGSALPYAPTIGGGRSGRAPGAPVVVPRRIRMAVTVNGAQTSSLKTVRIFPATLILGQQADGFRFDLVAGQPTTLSFNPAVIDGIRFRLEAVDGTGLGAVRFFTITQDAMITVDLTSDDIGVSTLDTRPAPALALGNGPMFRVPGAVVKPVMRSITARVMRNGEQTPSVKTLKIFASEGATAPMALFNIQSGYELVQKFAAAAIDGDRFVQALDPFLPKVGALRWPTINQDVILLFNLTDDDGSAGGGVTATLDMVVRVDGVGASADVVGIEKMDGGKWRISGFGTTGADGTGELALKVIPSSTVYALAIADFGVPFQVSSNVAVGALIRPTLFAGWLYEITEAGVLPAIEPVWWDENTIGTQQLGTARAQVVRYYRPLAHGPIPVEFS